MIKQGDQVRISPDLTLQEGWIDGQVIEVDKNPFVGIVISAKTDKGAIFFGREDLFLPA